MPRAVVGHRNLFMFSVALPREILGDKETGPRIRTVFPDHEKPYSQAQVRRSGV